MKKFWERRCKSRERKCETIFFINTFSLRTFVINLLSAFSSLLFVGDVEFIFASEIQYLHFFSPITLRLLFTGKYSCIFFLVPGAAASDSCASCGGMFCHHNCSNFITIPGHYELSLGCFIVCNMFHCRAWKCSYVRGRRNCAIAALCTNNGTS